MEQFVNNAVVDKTKKKTGKKKKTKADEKKDYERNAKNWAVTINCLDGEDEKDFMEKHVMMVDRMKTFGIKFIFQVERGEKGRLHFQMFVHDDTKHRKNFWIVFFSKMGFKREAITPSEAYDEDALKRMARLPTATIWCTNWLHAIPMFLI